jgi:dihydrofolate synthase/folylpolyglutamate synthase
MGHTTQLDNATTDRPSVAGIASGRAEAVLNRLHGLHPRLIDLSLGRLEGLLARLGHPERRLPPVIHVAGTNGKGSTCAFARAIAEAAGLRAHVYTSPHLVRFNERIRLAGALVSDELLASTLEEIEQVNAGAPITVFEVITAVALLLFARIPADVTILEVGLGGRFDATNVIGRPAASAITSISADHHEFLGNTLTAIAGEKAGIIKPGAPCATGLQTPEALAVLEQEAAAMGAPLLLRGRDWTVTETPGGMAYADTHGSLTLPRPSLAGSHQLDNAGIAIAALRASGLPLASAAFGAGIASAEWPARMQRLRGKLAALLPAGWELWLDGGHNPGAGDVLATHLATWTDRPTHLLVGMKQSKAAREFLEPLLPFAASVQAVAEPGQHQAMPVQAIIEASGGIATAGPDVVSALHVLARTHPAPAVMEYLSPARVLVCGSLYLAGEVLKLDQDRLAPDDR